jgi:hypothetical protein
MLEYTQEIQAQHFADGVLAVAAGGHAGGEGGIAGGVFQALGHLGAVEVGAEHDVVRAGYAHEIVDVVQRVLDRGLAGRLVQEGVDEGDADQAAAAGDGLDLRVKEVARVVAQDAALLCEAITG